LYGLKTSAARFHEHLSELLLTLGFKKNKHDPDLWMVDKSSNYEYLATYVDEILIWRKDPMDTINSMEKVYMFKSVDIFSRIPSRWKCGVPWRCMEESGISIGCFYKIPLFKTSFRNLKVFLAKSLSPSRHP
jgi:hypothetical protein